jgi:hypothetical protein
LALVVSQIQSDIGTRKRLRFFWAFLHYERTVFTLVRNGIVVSSNRAIMGEAVPPRREVAEWAMSYHGAGDGWSGGCWAGERWTSILSARPSVTAGKRNRPSQTIREKETGGRARNGVHGKGGSRRRRHEVTLPRQRRGGRCGDATWSYAAAHLFHIMSVFRGRLFSARFC